MKKVLWLVIMGSLLWVFADGVSSSSPAVASKPDFAAAVTLVEAHDYEAAIAIFADLVKAEPENADVHNMYAYSLRKLGNYEEAHTHYMHALELEPLHLGANEYLGELYLETGKLNLAKKRLQVLYEADSCAGTCEQYEDLAAAIAAYKD